MSFDLMRYILEFVLVGSISGVIYFVVKSTREKEESSDD
jgi:hypothetical protein